MAKPILHIKMPEIYYNESIIDFLEEKINKKFIDYHVLITTTKSEEFCINVLNGEFSKKDKINIEQDINNIKQTL